MPSIVEQQTARASITQVTRSLADFCYAVVWNCVWKTLLRLPLAVAAGVVLGLALAAISALALPSAESSLLRVSGLVLLFGCYVAAGVVAGLHWTVRRGVASGLAVFEKHAAELIDQLLAPLVDFGNGRAPQIPIADVRGCVQQAAGEWLPATGRLGWLAMPLKPARALARWWLSEELAVVDKLLTSLEQQGQTHVTIESLQGYARDQFLAHARRLAKANLLQLNVVAGIVIGALLSVPPLWMWFTG